jgi:hypothetical protein
MKSTTFFPPQSNNYKPKDENLSLTNFKTLKLQEQPNPPYAGDFYTINESYGVSRAIQSYPITFSPNGSIFASINDNFSISLWDVASNGLIKTIGSHNAPFDFIVFSPDGTLIASGGESPDYSIKLWEVNTGNLIYKMTEHNQIVKSVAFSPDGLILASGGRGLIKLWNIMTGEVKTLVDDDDWTSSVVFSPNGTLLATANWNSNITLWQITSGPNPLNGTELKTLTGHSQAVHSIAFSPDGNQLISGGRDDTIRIWDLTTLPGEITTPSILQTSADVWSVAYSPDGTRFAAGIGGISEGKMNVGVWNVGDNSPSINLSKHANQVRSVAFSPEGTILASSSWDRTIKFWNIAQIPNDLDIDGLDDNWETTYGLNSSDFWDKFSDPDNDGLMNCLEFFFGFNATSNDTDLDQLPDGWEYQFNLDYSSNDANEDYDRDGLSNLKEYQNQSNPINPFDIFWDQDSDEMSDGWESYYGLDPTIPNDAQNDTDEDKIPNIWEQFYQLNPIDPEDAGLDKDNDGITNGYEHLHGLNLLDPIDANEDYDRDGLTNLQEYLSNFNLSASDKDTDSDGMNDSYEIQNGFNPTNLDDSYGDSDDDEMRNGWEVNYNLNPWDPSDAQKDADGDGMPNFWEAIHTLNPRDSSDAQKDPDGDKLPNWWEFQMGLNPGDENDALIDSDGDNLINIAEFNFSSSAILNDTDGDGMLDYYEYQMKFNPNYNESEDDFDGDGMTNIWEYLNHFNATNRLDGREDPDGDGILNIDEFKADTDPHDFWSFPLISLSRIHVILASIITLIALSIFTFQKIRKSRRRKLILRFNAPDYSTALLIASAGYTDYNDLIDARANANILITKGIRFYSQGSFRQAILTLEKALSAFERLRSDRFIAETVYLMAKVHKEMTLLSEESSFLRRFPKPKNVPSIIHGFDLMVKALLAEQSNNWGVAEQAWREAATTDIEVRYQLICQGALLELEFQSLLTNPDDAAEEVFLVSLTKWQDQCKENQLHQELCHAYILRGKYSFAKYQLDNVDPWYELCMSLAQETGLDRYYVLAQDERANFLQHRQQLAGLLETDKLLSPEEQESRFQEYMRNALKSLEKDRY